MERNEMIEEVVRLALQDDPSLDVLTLRNELGSMTPSELTETYTVFVETQDFIDRCNRPLPGTRRPHL